MVFVFGAICIDRLRRIPHFPQPGGYVEIESEDVMLGGEAANTAIALTSWGTEVTLAGNGLGTDADGDLLRSMVEARSLPLGLLRAGDQAAPVCEIYVTTDGDRTMFGRGFSHLSEPIPVEQLPYRKGDWFTAEPNLAGYARAVAAEAAHRGMKPYLMDFIRDDEPISPGSVWQSSTDWAGHRGNTQKNVQWVREWADRWGCTTILSDGPNGFVAGGPTLPTRHYPPFPAPSVVDTTGAGDMFRAGVLFGLQQGWDLARSLQFGSAAGCLKCGYFGANQHVPSVGEIEAHIAAHPDVSRAYFGS
ncbi:MAG: carbohydrate kinase family protein [Fimbriimonas sp.]